MVVGCRRQLCSTCEHIERHNTDAGAGKSAKQQSMYTNTSTFILQFIGTGSLKFFETHFPYTYTINSVWKRCCFFALQLNSKIKVKHLRRCHKPYISLANGGECNAFIHIKETKKHCDCKKNFKTKTMKTKHPTIIH